MEETEKQEEYENQLGDPDVHVTERERHLLRGATAKEYVQMIRIMTRVQEYVQIGIPSAILARNEAMKNDNSNYTQYQQGTLDVLIDLREILNGNKIQQVQLGPNNEQSMEVG